LKESTIVWRGIFGRQRNVKSDGVFMPCDNCKATLVVKDVEANLSVCPECDWHFRIGARRRVELIVDPDSWKELFGDLAPVDPLQFAGKRSYAQRLQESQKRSGLKDAIVTGVGSVQGRRAALAVTDSSFMMGSMGSVVGEKITRTVEYATQHRLPVVIVSGSGGGARMDEGALSLMQMAKTSAALAKHREARCLYVSVITNPTYGGVSASFATLGDINLAEPKAQMGFTGPRVIQQTIKAELPDGFQTAEFLLEHGQLDLIVRQLFDYLMPEGKVDEPEKAGQEAG
jgi:acetyl-CoA carboxylase carboxyl transferase subunit beta